MVDRDLHEPICDWLTRLDRHPRRPSLRCSRAAASGASRRPASLPVCLWLRSQRPRLGRGGRASRTGPKRSPLGALVTTDKLAGGIALSLALALVLGLGAFTAPLASAAVVAALLLVGMLGPSAVARQLAGTDPAAIGLRAPYGLLAAASRTRSGRAYAPKRLTAR